MKEVSATSGKHKAYKTVVGKGPGYFRYEGKWYTRDKNGELIRFYPPDETPEQ